MNRKDKRAIKKANLKMIADKTKRVKKTVSTTLRKFNEYAEQNSIDLSDETLGLLFDGKHENAELQSVFNKYKEAKRALTVLAIMKKGVMDGLPQEDEENKQ